MLALVDSNAFHSCQVGWMSFGWRAILDTHSQMMSVKNPTALQFLTNSNRCAWHLPPYPLSKALTYFVLPIHPLNGTHKKIHVSIVSRLKNPTLTCLFFFIYTD